MSSSDSTQQADIDTKRAQNESAPINRIPRELLSRIFMIGDDMQRAKRLKVTEDYFPFPQIIAQICSHLRDVAINTPLLWSYIYIGHPPPHPLAVLYLCRAGADTPLELDLEMRTKYWKRIGLKSKDWERHVHHIPDLFHFLASNGAHIRRWKSLIAYVKTPRVAYLIIRILNAEPSPALRFFSCKWRPGQALEYAFEEPHSLINMALQQRSPTDRGSMPTMCGSSFPSLRSVDLTAMPWSFVLARTANEPLFTDLISLRLTAAFSIWSHDCFYNLLSANPQLEELYLNCGFDAGEYNPPPLPRARLSCLRRLELCSYSNIAWLWHTLITIRASNLEHFSLAVGPEASQSSVLLTRFLICFATWGVLPDTNPPKAKPIFPSLRSLDVASVYASCNDFKILLSAFPFLRCLTMTSQHVDVLGQNPGILPNLSCLKLHSSVPLQLEDIMRNRLEAGSSAPEVEWLGIHSLHGIFGGLPDITRMAGVPRPDLEVDLDLDATDEDEPDDQDN